MAAPLQRVVNKKLVLDDEITELEELMGGETFSTLPKTERVLLRNQLSHMLQLSFILGARIGGYVCAEQREEEQAERRIK